MSPHAPKGASATTKREVYASVSFDGTGLVLEKLTTPGCPDTAFDAGSATWNRGHVAVPTPKEVRQMKNERLPVKDMIKVNVKFWYLILEEFEPAYRHWSSRRLARND